MTKKYNFDKNALRTNYDERRYDQTYLEKTYQLTGKVYNFGIADINYQVPDPIYQALKSRVNKKTFSYTYVSEKTLLAIQHFYQRQNIDVDKKDIRLVHGTVNAMFNIVQAYSEIGDAILIQTPIYKPFSNAILLNDRKIVENKLIFNEKTLSYEIDFVDFEQKIIDNNIHLFMFCSPHNPGSTVWSKQVIDQVLDICQKHDVIVFADEVHSMITYVEFYSTWNHFDKLIIGNSPNKVFNLGGLKASYLLIKNHELKSLIDRQYAKNSLTSPNDFVNPAFQAAYLNQECYDWAEELKIYIYQNYLYLKKELENFNLIVFDLQSTYLVWIKTNFNSKMLLDYLLKENIILVDYHDFYGCDPTFLRINIATRKKDLIYLVSKLKSFFRRNELNEKVH